MKIFNPYAVSNRSSTPRAVYRSHENMKKRSCQVRICEVEHGTLQLVGCLMKPTPFTNIWLLFCQIGGMD